MLTPEQSAALRRMDPELARQIIWKGPTTAALVSAVPGVLDVVFRLSTGLLGPAGADYLVSKLVGFDVHVEPMDFTELLEVAKHMGPGPHPGTGTDQSVHGSGVGRINVASPGSGAGKSRTYDPTAEYRSDHATAAALDPGWESKVLAKAQELPGFGQAETLDDVVALLEHNVEQTYQRGIQHEDSELWKTWYPLGNKLGAEWAMAAGVHPDVAYAVIARLSPQSDWDANLVMASEVIRILDQDPVITDDLRDIGMSLMQEINSRRKTPLSDDELPSIEVGKKLSELSPEAAAHVVRGMSQAEGTKLPDGSGFRWQSEYNLARSVEMFRAAKADDYGAIDGLLGVDMKIRSFYNNLRDPFDTNFGEVTVDTHATGIALGVPLTTSAREITTSMERQALLSYDGQRGKLSSLNVLGSPSSTKAGVKGMYPLIADAYRNVAARRGVLPREVQSVTWEQWRYDWPAISRKKWVLDTVRGIHHEMGHNERADAAIEEFRLQMPGVAPRGSGAGKPESVTGGATRWSNQYGEGYVWGEDERQK